MSGCDKTLDVRYTYRLLFGKRTNGNSCFSVKSQLMTADIFPRANSLNRVFADTLLLQESVTFHFTQRLSDTVILEEAQTIVWTPQRAFAENFGFSEQFIPVLDWNRAFADTVGFVEDVSLSTSKPFDEAVTLVEGVAKTVRKVFADTILLVEAASIGGRNNLADTTSMVEHGTLLNQGYYDHTGAPLGYYADDYFGVKRTW